MFADVAAVRILPDRLARSWVPYDHRCLFPFRKNRLHLLICIYCGRLTWVEAHRPVSLSIENQPATTMASDNDMMRPVQTLNLCLCIGLCLGTRTTWSSYVIVFEIRRRALSVDCVKGPRVWCQMGCWSATNVCFAKWTPCRSLWGVPGMMIPRLSARAPRSKWSFKLQESSSPMLFVHSSRKTCNVLVGIPMPCK